jgi:hypothetical protein
MCIASDHLLEAFGILKTDFFVRQATIGKLNVDLLSVFWFERHPMVADHQ